MGANAILARTPGEIRDAIGAARTSDRITVIHVPVSPEHRAPGYEGWWDVPPAEVSEQPGPRDARARYEDERPRQRTDLA
jgi:3D-(3,5/4)-trihydroxycyclohexane-1,2-dione acylhydrolase (decyclizing)